MAKKHTMKALDPKKSRVFGTQPKKKNKPKGKCRLAGCNNPLTEYKGIGMNSLCEEHQKTLREYKGFARYEKPYTMWKGRCCERCGDIPFRHISLRDLDKETREVYGYTYLHVDHIKPPKTTKEKHKMESRCNHPSNLQTLCEKCHTRKTLENMDFSNKQ